MDAGSVRRKSVQNQTEANKKATKRYASLITGCAPFAVRCLTSAKNMFRWTRVQHTHRHKIMQSGCNNVIAGCMRVNTLDLRQKSDKKKRCGSARSRLFEISPREGCRNGVIAGCIRRTTIKRMQGKSQKTLGESPQRGCNTTAGWIHISMFSHLRQMIRVID